MITTIENSPVKFLATGEVTHNDLGKLCNCRGQIFEQRVQCDDSSNFQVGLTELDGIEQVLNGGFTTAADWTFGNNWAHDAGNDEADHTAGGGTSDLTQSAVGRAGCFYKLVFTVRNTTAGSVTPKLGTNALTAQTANGTFTQFGFFQGNETLTFTADDPFDGSITNISIKEMSQVGFGIRNTITGDYLFIDVDNTNVIYLEDKPQAQVNFDWSDLSIGYTCPDVCVQICLFDIAADTLGPDLVVNGGFDADTDWIKGVRWTIAGGLAVFTPLAGVTVNAIAQDFGVIFGGRTYRLQFTIVTFVDVFVGQQIVSDAAGAIRTTTGTFVDILTPTVDGAIVIIGASFVAGTMEVDNYSVREVIDIEAGIRDGSIQPITCSENYHIKDTWDCTILLEWTNDENAFGFNYTDFVFNQSLRVSAKLRNTTSEKINKTIFTNSQGAKKILFSQTFRIEELIVDEIPEYLHRSLDIGIEHDTFTIDNTGYMNEEEEYVPNWRKSSLLAPITLAMKKKVQFLENNNC